MLTSVHIPPLFSHMQLLFIQFPVDRHLDSFQLFSIINEFSVNILHASLCSYEYFLRIEIKEEYLLDHRI